MGVGPLRPVSAPSLRLASLPPRRRIEALRYTDLSIMAAIVQIRIPQTDGPSAVEKERQLLADLAVVPSLIVALSGGADSAYLAWAAQKALGTRALSITALSPSYSTHDRNIVEDFVHAHNIHHEFV